MAGVLARSAIQKLRFSTLQFAPVQNYQRCTRRGFAADHHGSSKVNIWQEPLNPGNWKEEQFVFVSLGGWGLLFYAGYKAATGGKKEPAPAESK